MARPRNIRTDFTEITREKAFCIKKKPRYTSLIIIDSQAVKNTCNAAKKTSGFCFYKSTNGIKRHLAVDSLGLPFFTHCTPANISDDQGLIDMLTNNIDYFKSKPMNVPKITILLDNGYHPDKIITALSEVYPNIMRKVTFERSPKPSKEQKEKAGKKGFVPVAARWVVERSNAWMERCKILAKNYERNLKNANTKIQLCFLRHCC